MSTAKKEKFPERLRTARELRKMSQGDLAEKTGLQASAISHFETGRRSPSFDNLKRLADALNVTTDYLLGRVGDPGSVGPGVDTLFRNAGKLSESDLEVLKDMARSLAKRHTPKREDGE